VNKARVAIIDYGMGNIWSVQNALVEVGARSEVIACSNARPPTCDVADGAHVIDLQRFEVGGDTAVIRVVISTHVRHKDGGARLFPVLREITLNQVRGVWRVVGDAVLMRA